MAKSVTIIYGETRLTTGTIYTDKLFTGQREMTGLGIYHYGARFYSPKVGRFLSPDTIIPGAANPQAYNRYSYVLNNPIRYTDPTGHMVPCEEGDVCRHYPDPKDDPEPDPDPDDGGGNCNNDPDCRGGDGGSGSDRGGAQKPLLLLLPQIQTDDVACNGGDSNVGCTLYGDVLLLEYYGQVIAINVANVKPEDVIKLTFLLNQFSSLAVTRSESKSGMVTNSIYFIGSVGAAIGGGLTAAAGFSGTAVSLGLAVPVSGPVAVGGAVVAGAGIITAIATGAELLNNAQSYANANNNLANVMVQLQQFDAKVYGMP